MTEARIPIFLTGATGYIGGSVLIRLLQHPSAKTFDITALVRSSEKAKRLESYGVKPVIGSLEDSALVEDVTSKAHAVFDTHDADNLKAMQAILRGMRKRHKTTGDVPVLIHTSGTGLLTDDAKDLYATDVIYDDLDAEKINVLPDSVFHRDVDLEVIAEDNAAPSTVLLRLHWWMPVSRTSISIQIPLVIKASLGRKQAGMVGKDAAIWPNVHINDVADLYIILLDAIIANPDTVAHGDEGYYFVENGEYTWYELARAIGEALVELGVSKDPEPTSFTDEELIKYFGTLEMGTYFGCNTRCRASRGRSIGWKPKYTTKDVMASIKPEVEAILKRQK